MEMKGWIKMGWGRETWETGRGQGREVISMAWISSFTGHYIICWSV